MNAETGEISLTEAMCILAGGIGEAKDFLNNEIERNSFLYKFLFGFGVLTATLAWGYIIALLHPKWEAYQERRRQKKLSEDFKLRRLPSQVRN